MKSGMRWVGYGLALAAVVLSVILATRFGRDPGLVESPLIGQPAPEFTLPSLDGEETVSLTDLRGDVVVVNFFASWCAPCVEEMPAFEAVHQDVGDRVTLIGMANQDAPENALETVAATGVTYPTFGDPDGDALTFFGGLAMPTTVFIDTDGEVVEVHSGALTEDELRAKLGELFGVEA